MKPIIIGLILISLVFEQACQPLRVALFQSHSASCYITSNVLLRLVLYI